MRYRTAKDLLFRDLTRWEGCRATTASGWAVFDSQPPSKRLDHMHTIQTLLGVVCLGVSSVNFGVDIAPYGVRYLHITAKFFRRRRYNFRIILRVN
jgi:hypothetical protein